MPAPSAAAISSVSASRVIMVPVGLAGLADQHALERRLAMRGEQRLAGQRVAGLAEVSISTGSQPSAVRICRYGG